MYISHTHTRLSLSLSVVLEGKQTTQAKQILHDIKEALAPARRRTETRAVIDSGISVNTIRRRQMKRRAAKEKNNRKGDTFLTEG